MWYWRLCFDFFRVGFCFILEFFCCLCHFLFAVGTVSTSDAFYCDVLFCCNIRVLRWHDKVFDFFVGNQYC